MNCDASQRRGGGDDGSVATAFIFNSGSCIRVRVHEAEALNSHDKHATRVKHAYIDCPDCVRERDGKTAVGRRRVRWEKN